MEEQNDLEKDLVDTTKADTTTKSDNSSSSNNDSKSNTFFKDIQGEFRKIIWPSRHELFTKTTTVIVISLLFGVVLFGMETVYGLLLTLLTNFVTKA